MDILFTTKRLNVCKAEINDIDLIIELENHRDNRNFVWQGTYEEHLSEISDKNS